MKMKTEEDIGTRAMRSIITLVVLILLPHLVIYCWLTFSSSLDKRQDQLVELAVKLGQSLDQQALQSLVSAPMAAADQQSRVLAVNRLLQPAVAALAAQYPGVGMGIYSRQLDSVVATIPFAPVYLSPIEADSTYFKSYQTGTVARLTNSTSISWNGSAIAAATYPLTVDGEIVGHVWANQKLRDVIVSVAASTLALALGYTLAAYLICGSLQRSFGTLRAGIKQAAREATSGHSVTVPVMPELRELMDALQRSQTLTERLFKLSLQPTCIFNRQGKLLSANPAFLEMVGYHPTEIDDLHIQDLVNSRDTDKCQRGAARLLSGQRLSDLELQLCRRDGQLRWTSWSCVPDPELSSIYATAKDMTALKQLEEQMKRLDRLDLAGQMAAAISHEIRNPLTTIRGYLQLMQIKTENAADRERLGLLISELDRANGIISEFLALARNHQSNKIKTDLNDLIKRLAPLLQADCLMQNCELRLCLNDLPALHLDEREIRQLLLNLARNSLDAMPTGGTLTIASRLDGHTVCLAVEDQGSGIPEALLERVFDPFFTTKASGTGLGLAICSRIALENGATISVQKSDQSGTRIEVRFVV